MPADALLAARIVAFALGAALVLGTLRSVILTFVLPRNTRDKTTWTLFRLLGRVVGVLVGLARSYERRDAIMAMYAPVGLLLLPIVWLALLLAGFSAMFWALGAASWREALLLSGSSLLTLGFAALPTLAITLLAFIEAGIGLMMVALFIGYLPTMYGAWSRRETAVSMLEIRAGAPPSAVEMLTRYHHAGHFGDLTRIWPEWEQWFIELEQSHTTLAALSLFRSPSPRRSWITAGGTILDTAALLLAAVDLPTVSEAALCIRAGSLAFRGIAQSLLVEYNPQPLPGQPISVTRAEFDEALARLAAEGIALKPDREQAWHDFAGWRINYDMALLGLAHRLMAPPAPWTADRLPMSLAPARQASLAAARR